MNTNWKRSLAGVCLIALGSACGGGADAGAVEGTGETAANLSMEVVSQGAGGVPSFIRGNFGSVAQVRSGLRGASLTAEAERTLAPVLRGVAPLFRLSPKELRVRTARVDEVGNTHVRYDQVRNGVRVVGGELILHVAKSGTVYAVNGSARGAAEPATLSLMAPRDAAVAALEGSSTLKPEGEPQMVYFLDAQGTLSLAYEQLRSGERDGEPARDIVYVDASSGRVLDVHPQLHSAQARRVHTANNGSALPGTLRRAEGGGAAGDAHVDLNYDHIGTTYACYETIFARDSFNDAGATITSTVHYGNSYVNAFWNGSQIVFGDGDNFNSGELGRDLDVVSHEFTHAVTQYESGLVYRNDSGALNESLSDIAAAICESWARGTVDADVWKIGEDIWTPGTAGDALRYMGNPTQDGSSRDYYPERYVGTSDNGGVHWNSGIPNLAFKLLVTGGSHPRGKTAVNVAGVGMNRAAQTFYFANQNYFTANINMSQARALTIQAASDRYPLETINAVRDAWSAVGVQ
jgi:bacillolysin